MDQNSLSAGSNKHRGSSLLEVMVALIILSIGLLGLALLQLDGLKFNTNAYLRSQATLHANDIIERMRANSGAATTYTAAPPGAPPAKDCSSSTDICSAIELATHDLFEWSQSLANPASGLPSATTTISATTIVPNRYNISINWDERGVPVSQSWVVQL